MKLRIVIFYDEEVRKGLEETNPWALSNMIERLFEANRRGYWQASDERLESLRSIYLEYGRAT